MKKQNFSSADTTNNESVNFPCFYCNVTKEFISLEKLARELNNEQGYDLEVVRSQSA